MKLQTFAFGGGILLFAAFNPMFGATIDWTTWTSQPSSTTVNGTLMVGSTPVSVGYSGEIAFTQLNNTGGNFYQPASTFTAPPTVTNAPPSDMIAIDGTATTHTITFGTAIVNPIMEIVSLGQPGVGTEYDFSLLAGQSMSILAQGPSNAYGGCSTCLSLTGSTITGHEGDGIVQFTGTFSSWFSVAGKRKPVRTSGYAGLTAAGNAAALGIGKTALALVLFGKRQHVVGHVAPVGLPRGADASSRQQYVDAAARAQVENGLAGL